MHHSEAHTQVEVGLVLYMTSAARILAGVRLYIPAIILHSTQAVNP